MENTTKLITKNTERKLDRSCSNGVFYGSTSIAGPKKIRPLRSYRAVGLIGRFVFGKARQYTCLS